CSSLPPLPYPGPPPRLPPTAPGRSTSEASLHPQEPARGRKGTKTPSHRRHCWGCDTVLRFEEVTDRTRKSVPRLPPGVQCPCGYWWSPPMTDIYNSFRISDRPGPDSGGPRRKP